jgi:Flp pilus assembly protein TadD
MKNTLLYLMLISTLSAPCSSAVAFNSISESIQKGNEADAINEVNRHIQKYPKDPELRFIRGAIHSHFGNMNAAKEDFLSLAYRYPKDPTIKNNLGVIFTKLGDLDMASTYFKEALKLKPDYLEARKNLFLVKKKVRVDFISRQVP